MQICSQLIKHNCSEVLTGFIVPHESLGRNACDHILTRCLVQTAQYDIAIKHTSFFIHACGA